MLGAGIAFLIGIGCVLYAPTLTHAGALLGLALCSLCVITRQRYRCLLLMCCCGAAWMVLHAQQRITDALPVALQGRDLLLQGRIADVPTVRGDFTRFVFDIDRNVPGLTLPGRVRLSWFGDVPALAYGERWQLTVRLKRPHGLRNPGGFDYERWLMQRGIRALGYVREASDNRRLGAQSADWLTEQRQRIATAIDTAGYRHSALLNALTTGLRHRMSDTQWQVLRATGTSHLFAISGLHVGLIAMLGHWLFGAIWRASTLLSVCFTRARFAACGALMSAAGYAALAGFSVPTQRALIMLAVLLLGVFCARGIRPGASLGAALLLVLIVDPWSALRSGFWLSFGAVTAIAWLLSGRVTPATRVVAFGRVQCGLAVLLAPLSLWFFSQAPLLGAAANALAVPVVSFVTVPAALGGLLWAELFAQFDNPPLRLADASLELLWALLVPVSRWPQALWTPVAVSWLTVALAAIGVVLLTAPRNPVPRHLGWVLLAPLAFPPFDRADDGSFDLHVLDVGQGLAVIVETHDHVLLYDAGVRLSAGYDMGREVVLPFLRRRGRHVVDKLVVSHADLDHAGGVASVVAALRVNELLTSDPAARPILHTATRCRAGTRWHWDGVLFAIVHPPEGWPGGRNDRSCVLRISTGRRAVLLPGDIERAAEARLAALPDPVRADVLVVPHHGSDTSSTADLLARIQPEYAVVSAGYRNRFGFPHPRVCARLRAHEVRTFSTATSGALSFRVAPDRVTVGQGYRQLRRRFWHANLQHGRCTTR